MHLRHTADTAQNIAERHSEIKSIIWASELYVVL